MKDCVKLLLYDTSGMEISRLPKNKKNRLSHTQLSKKLICPWILTPAYS